MSLILILAILGCIPGAIASSKGRSFFGWWLYGALLFIVALIHSLCLKKDRASIERSLLSEGLVKCHYCAEMIKPEAIKCKHCGSDVESEFSKVFVSDISSYKVTAKLAGEDIIDEYKIDGLVSLIMSGNESKDREKIIEAYSIDIEKLANTLPDNLRQKFKSTLRKYLIG